MDSISEVKKLAKKIKEEARTCLHERILNVDESLSRVHNTMGKLSEAFYRFLQSNPIHTVQPSSGESMYATDGSSLTAPSSTPSIDRDWLR